MKNLFKIFFSATGIITLAEAILKNLEINGDFFQIYILIAIFIAASSCYKYFFTIALTGLSLLIFKISNNLSNLLLCNLEVDSTIMNFLIKFIMMIILIIIIEIIINDISPKMIIIDSFSTLLLLFLNNIITIFWIQIIVILLNSIVIVVFNDKLEPRK